jgi:hypothetical protein
MLKRILFNPAVIVCAIAAVLLIVGYDAEALGAAVFIGAGPLVNVDKSKIVTRLGYIDFAERATKTLRLDQYGVCTSLRLRLAFTITAGSSAMVGAKPFVLSRLFKRVDLNINGQDTLQTIDGPALVARQLFERGVRPYGMDATFVLTGSSTVTSYEIVLELPQALPRAIMPLDTGLDFRKINQAILSVLWGDINDLVATANGAAISAVTCEVEGEFLAAVAENQVFMARDLASAEHQVNGANTDFAPYPIDRGNYWLRSFTMTTDSDASLVNTIINNVMLKGGNFVFADRGKAMLLADQAHVYQKALAERQAGIFRLELPMIGMNNTCIFMGNPAAPDLFLRFNVAHPGTTDYIRISREGLRDYTR